MRGRRPKRFAVTRKYRNIVTATGFDSRKEERIFGELKLLQAVGDIASVRRQVSYELLPAQRDTRGKLLERNVRYIADFLVTYRDGREEVIDVKSPITRRLPAYVIKRKLMLFRLGLRVSER